MTSISYEEIFSDFLGNITDYQIASMNMSDAFELMTEYLHKVLSHPYVRSLFSSIELDDSIQRIGFEMDYVVDEVTDRDFVLYIVSKGMVVEWLRPQVRNKVNISQMFSGKEQKFYAQSNHISEIRAMLEDTELDLRKTIRSRNYINNSYLDAQ